MIPPNQNSDFVAQMEQVLDVYKRPYNPRRPVVCMDESPKQLIRETRIPLSGKPGRLARYDYEYRRCGVCSIFMANEPLVGKRYVQVCERRTKQDWSMFLKVLSGRYPEADVITLVLDNLNTHKPGALYATFAPEEARTLRNRFELVYTPKHGSWLNMAEIELNVLNGQCLNRRIDTLDTVARECNVWQNTRNNMNATINWQFTTQDARVKLKRLYPTLQE